MKNCESSFRGIVLQESLQGAQLPPSLQESVIASYTHLLDGVVPTTVLKLEVPASCVDDVANQLANCLLPQRYFAQLTGQSVMYIVFPGCWYQIGKGERESAEMARVAGEALGIPRHQMRFEEMFEHDHPNNQEGDEEHGV